MTRPARAAFRGEVTAAAYLLDVPTIGESAARDRVLARWTPGTRLLRWPDGGWLLVLGAAETVQAERAPGLPLVGGPDGLATPGEPVTAGAVRVPRGESTASIPFGGLAAVDVGAWLEPGDLAPVALEPVERALVVTEPDPPPRTEEPDLRVLAGVGEASRGAQSFTDGVPKVRTRAVLLLLAAVVVLGAVVTGVVLLTGGGGDPPRAVPPPAVTPTPTPTPGGSVIVVPDGPTFTLDPTDPLNGVGGLRSLSGAPASPSGTPSWAGLAGPLLFLGLAAVVVLARARRRRPLPAKGAGARSSAPRPRRWREALARLVLGTPAGGVIGRRHARYLDKLTRDLESGRWGDALPAAIGLGGGPGGVLSLRLPRRRDSLSPVAGGGPGSVVPWGPTVSEHLRGLYVQAAERLEREGNIEQAAFVLAVLMHDPAAAVALLERSGNPALAARIAEARNLDPALAVRLWWQAGDRERAVDIARARGAFAAAVVRLERVDPALGRELRTAWVDTARRAGDAVTAVDAAWPDPELRRASLPDLRAGLDAGGPAAGTLLARFLAGDWDTRPLAGVAVDLVSADTPAETSLRTGFLTAFAEHHATDPGLDRRLASAAALATLREPGALTGVPRREAKAAVAALRARADPVLAADLPPWSAAPAPAGPLEVDVDGPPGLAPVHDAVVLADGSVLAALGELGLRWLTAAGHVRAQWSVPVHGLVLADHGGSALLLRAAGEETEIQRLDLVDRRIRPWTTLRVRGVAGSFDGSALATITDNGIEMVDTLSPRPRVAWRELSAEQPVLAITRTPTRLTAVAVAPPLPPSPVRTASAVRAFELFDWELPSMTLRLRRRFDPPVELGGVLVLPGHAVLIGRERKGTVHFRAWSPPAFDPLPPDHRLSVDGDALLSVGPGDGGGFAATVTVEGRGPFTVRGPASSDDVRVHRHGDVVTVFDGAGGRVVGIDVVRREVVTRVRTAV